MVAVPVRDEADRIAACLTALTMCQTVPPDAVVLAINNTTDATEAVVRALLPQMSVPVDLLVHDFQPELACAGAARRLALETAVRRYGPEILLTTDADSLVPTDWIEANIRLIRDGADAVAGRAVLSDADAATIPARLILDDERECAYAAALDTITALVDPDPWDELPRHSEHSGASIAVRSDAYRLAGGMPASFLGEDRDFFAALRRIDARIRHAPDITVTVSARLIGRAEGGMADTIRRRLQAPDPYLDSALEPADALLRRVTLRRALRELWNDRGGRECRVIGGGAASLADLATQLDLGPLALAQALDSPFFGTAWQTIECASPRLQRRPVPVAAVIAEQRRADHIIRDLHAKAVAAQEPVETAVTAV